MKLKKIKPGLQQALEENGLTESNELQQETFATIKSGADCVIIAPDGSGKTTTIVINVIQQLVSEAEESPRAIIFAETKEKVLELEALFEKFGGDTPLQVYGVHDRGDIDYDKNYISTGIDVLIGTPNKLNEMFSSAGYNVNRLKMFIVDDANAILKARHDTKIARISDAISKTQRLIFSDVVTERLELFADKIMEEPNWFEFDDEDHDQVSEI
ncbi:MAG: DEAD/DEAH box helicase [Flavobacterium sp.]|nr:DEAD/DEAH box helicase [Flavobacterium sp.]